MGRRGPLRGTETSELAVRAYLTWIDDNLHMNNGVYFSQFERGRRDWVWRVGSNAFFKQQKCNIVLTGLTARFRKEIPALSAFQVHTRLIFFDELHLYLEQRIRDGMVHCIAYADLSIVDTEIGKRANTEKFISFLGLTD